jgi:hypothetical protein
MGTKVKSTVMCFYNGRRHRPGTVFELPDGVKPSHDMTVVEDEPKEKKAGKSTGKDKSGGPATFSEITKVDGAAQQAKGADDLT